MKQSIANSTEQSLLRSLKSRCSFRSTPIWVLLAILLVMTNILGVALLRHWSSSVKAWITRTDELLLAVSRATNLVEEAESARNLALLRQEGAYFEVLSRNEILLTDEVLPVIERLTRDVPAQAQNGSRFVGAVRMRLHQLREGATPREDGDLMTLLAPVEQSESDRSEGKLRKLSQRLVDEQDNLRNLRDDEFALALWRYISLIIACSSTLSILLVIAIHQMRRELVLRERAEVVARESERLEKARATELQTILDTVPAVILISQDRESRVVSGSREAYAKLKLPIGANTSKTGFLPSPQTFQLLQNGREVPPEELPVQYAARTGKPVRDTELEVVFSDGVVRHLFGSVEPLFDEAGNPRGSIAAFTDITERKEADLFLKASEARWKLSLETGQLGFFEYDYERGTTRWNDSEYRLIGYEPGGVEPSPEAFFHAVYPDDRERVRAEWMLALESGRLDVEFRIVRPDGEVRWLVGKGTVIQGAGGRKRWFTGVNIDITKAKRIEEELSRAVRERTEALNTLDAFMTAAPMGMAVLNREGHCRFINRQLTEMSGPLACEQEGSAAEAIPGLIQVLLPKLRDVVDHGLTIHDYQFEGDSPVSPGDRRTWIQSWFPIHGGANGVTGVGVIVQDVTDRRRAADELARHRDKLQELVDQKTVELADSLQRLHTSERLAALGTLAAGLGHDLANLVLPIRARLESLSLSPATPEMRADLVAIGQALDHLSNLSAGMRLMALDPNRRGAASEATDLSVWWSEAQGVFRGVLPRHVRLEGKITPGLGVAIPRHQLIQAVFNLVQNAGEVLDSDTDGWVRVEVVPDPVAADSYTLIKVSDNGPGMSDEVKARCFDPYFSTKGRAISTGMGLPLVRGIIESVNGSVSVESVRNVGTTFILRVPRRSAVDRLLARRGGRVHTAAISISEPRQAAIATMIAERLDLKVESIGDRVTPEAEVWITDGAPRVAVEHFLAEKEGHRVVYLGSQVFDPASFERQREFKGRVVALPARPAPTVLRDTIARVVGVVEEAIP